MTATNVNVAGTVKFFDQSKGFGIILTKTGDVFIHATRCGSKQADLVAGTEVRIDYTTAYKDGVYKHTATALLSVKAPPTPVEVLDVFKFYDTAGKKGDSRKNFGFILCPEAGFEKKEAFVSRKVAEVDAGVIPGKGMPVRALVIEKNGRPEVVSFEWGPEVEAAYSAKLAVLHAEDGAVVEVGEDEQSEPAEDPFASLFDTADVTVASEVETAPAPKAMKQKRAPKKPASKKAVKPAADAPVKVGCLADMALLVGQPNGSVMLAAA